MNRDIILYTKESKSCVCCEHLDVSNRWCDKRKQFVPDYVQIGKETWCNGNDYILAQCILEMVKRSKYGQTNT